VIADDQVEEMLAQFLCRRRGEDGADALNRAMEVVATVCQYRADGNAVPFLLGVARHAIAITSGRGVGTIIEVYGQLQAKCAAHGDCGEPVNHWGDWLAEAMCHVGEQAGARGLAERSRALLRKLSLERLRGLTVDQLAGEAGLSRAHFTAKLHEEEGITPHQLILAERMRRVIAMLTNRSTTPTVAEAAQSVGFTDAHYFRRVFHEVFGVPPSAFR